MLVVMTAVAGVAWHSAAQATILVDGSTFDFALSHRTTNGTSLEDIRFVVTVGAPERFSDGSSFGYADSFFFSEAETDLGGGRYDIAITLESRDDELFPDYGADDYGAVIGLGVFGAGTADVGNDGRRLWSRR